MTERPKLYCVEIRTSRWHDCLRWYRECLGLQVAVRMEEDGYALLTDGQQRLALLSRPTTDDASTRLTLAFEVDDLDAALEKVGGEGEGASPMGPDDEGIRGATISDPDGNRIKLFVWPDATSNRA